jgi:hypothetical protein
VQLHQGELKDKKKESKNMIGYDKVKEADAKFSRRGLLHRAFADLQDC